MSEIAGYLVHKRRRSKYKAHLWAGNDTRCRMYSTGGLRPDFYEVVQDTDLDICHLCSVAAEKRVQSKVDDGAESLFDLYPEDFPDHDELGKEYRFDVSRWRGRHTNG